MMRALNTIQLARRNSEAEMSQALSVEKIEDPTQFEGLRKEWNDLLESSASDCLFLTWEWLYTWWKHLSEDRRLFILAVRSGEKLAAIAPLALRPARLTHGLPFCSLEFLGTGNVGSDYLDLIVRRGTEQAALQALAQYLARGKFLLELTQVRKDSLAAKLTRQLEGQDWKFSKTETDACPFINLTGRSWEAYLAGLGRAHRYNFRRRLKNLVWQFDVWFKRVCSEEQRREATDLLFSLHSVRWRERGGSNAFHTRALRSFHEELSKLALQRDWLRLYVLWVGGKAAASFYGFRYNRTFLFYQSGFDPAYSKHSVGLVTMGLAIKSAIEEGLEEFDLLHGSERYKFLWACESRELARLELYPPGPRGLVYKRVLDLARTSKRMLRSVLPLIGS